MTHCKSILLIALVAFSYSCKGQYPEYTNLDPQAFAEQMKSDSVIVLDVRTLEEYQAGSIEGAVNLDFYDEQFAVNINTLDHSKHIMVYCAAGGRSARAAAILSSSGFKRISNLEDGMESWEKAKLPVVVEE